ncbi:M14 family metallopeptidase [Portibacter lacus]|uniref:Peptidase M14 n=1 Tax=Portibacter lacus TaxID=1099794 RepID=A0AA37SRZ0_9BACT|nr:M14 family metallopeptidase [Portibacter lacus]GLR19388.1 peptidase M14 [Portibacter lacus]
MKHISILLFIIHFLVLYVNGQKVDLNYYLPDITYDSSIPTPEEFLGYQVGEWHVSHDQLVYYMKELASHSDRITIETYARTHENRPLVLLTITSPKNQSNIDEIRKTHVSLSDPKESGQPIVNMPAVIYQGFSIHGNEPSGSNAALMVAYYLAAGQGDYINDLLDNVVILFDPCYNPDGLNRFASWVNTHKAKNLIADPSDREYSEAWPRGRTNHYWFDLNRDWLLLAHPESKGRIANFHKWKPNILTDHHEMGTNSTFFFQPGIETRVNPNTPQKNQDLTESIAEFHAEALDEIGSLYYSRESFDDYFYGKGSTYPDANGGIGILFEQGSSRGHVQESINGLVTFPFTIRNQVTTALSTQKAALNLRADLLSYQQEFYKGVKELVKKNPVKGYEFSSGKDKAKAKHFIDILLAHQIKVYEQGPDSYLVPLDQTQYRLAKTIFEKVTTFEDSLFYDVSAWTMPEAFDLDYQEIQGNLKLGNLVSEPIEIDGRIIGDVAKYAYVFEWNEYYAPKLLNKILNAGLRAKVSSEASTYNISNGTKSFGLGTIVVPIQNQELTASEMHNKMKEWAAETYINIYSVNSGKPSKGFDLGSPSNNNLIKANVMMFVGDGVSSYDAGEIWHLLDTRYDMTLTKLDVNDARSADYSRYSVIIMPAGNYRDLSVDALERWVANGGTLICYKSAIDWAKRNKLVNIETVSSEKDTSEERQPYHMISENNGRNVIGGAIFNTKLDLSNPLMYGIENDEMASFKRGTTFYELTKNVYASPAIYTEDPLISGYITKENLKALSGTAAVFVGGKGSGKVVCFADNTNFRGYWYGTNKLLANAIFFGHTISRSATSR